MLRWMYRIARLIALFVGIALLAGCGAGSQTGNNAPASLVRNVPDLPRATVGIPRGQDVFSPFILVVRPGTRITWVNNDTAAHNIVTILSDKSYVNPQTFRLHAPPGRSVSISLTVPGIYDYFDPLRASWNGTDHRIAAHQGVPHYPLSMEGIIWVQGPLSGLSTHVVNTIPGKDEFSQDFIAIPKDGKVTWKNQDTDNHVVAFVPGWEKPINPVDPGPLLVKGRAEQFGGAAETLTFSTPGLYYYYCSAHATINRAWRRAQANKDASEAPVPMEGFIVVTDKSA